MMPIQERIEIPASARSPKPLFPDFPDDGVVKEIRDFVAETGKPYLWRGHTHDAPKPGSELQYVEEFSLPRTCKARRTWSPCPCCLPFFPKYKNGKIAWFPEEKVIRLIGPDCYAKLDAEGHAAATEDLQKRQRERRDIEYLLKLGPSLGELKKAIERANAIAIAADDFFPRLRDRIELLKIRLWSAIRSGDLQVTEVIVERYRDDEGKEQERRTPISRRYATTKGVEALNPDRHAKSTRAGNLLARFDDPRLALPFDSSNLDSRNRREVAAKIARLVTDAERLFGEMRRELQLLRPENFQTLRTWSRLPDAPVRLFLEREPDAVIVGRRESERNRVSFSAVLTDRFPSIPTIAKTKIG